MNKVIVITGPTAVGKTKCSIEIAKKFNTEIINGDAYQIYQLLDIGTAKPTKEELSTIKHHLIDEISPLIEFCVADYQKLVRCKIADLKSRKKIPLIVGGSGLYIDSIISNYEFSGKKRNLELEEKYSKLSNEELYNELQKINYEKATSIHPNNRKRVLRAIELSLENPNFISRKNELVYDSLVIFLNDEREELYNRINKRVDEMFNNGLLGEVYDLYKNNLLGKTAKAAIGYKELFDYFEGLISLETAKDKIKQASRNYAKRQITWFNHKDYVKKIMIDYDNFDNTIEEVTNLIDEFLEK